MDDLFQIGCVGLIKEIDNFDITQDVQFSTYGVPMIVSQGESTYINGETIDRSEFKHFYFLYITLGFFRKVWYDKGKYKLNYEEEIDYVVTLICSTLK